MDIADAASMDMDTVGGLIAFHGESLRDISS
jgi:hypothetical protein